MSKSQTITPSTEALRLEALWGGEFGKSYTDRNAQAGQERQTFWNDILAPYQIETVLEIGCNAGANLRCLTQCIGPENIYGIDINTYALANVRQQLPQVNVLYSKARKLPFRDSWFDLTFTTGVLIHQPPETLEEVMSEIVRCSRRYVLCGEYYAEEPTEVFYRDQEGALFKRDFGALYQKTFPNLTLLKEGFLSPQDGWDDVTYWLFEKTE